MLIHRCLVSQNCDEISKVNIFLDEMPTTNRTDKLNDERSPNNKIKRCLEEFEELNSISHNAKEHTIYSDVRRIHRIGFLKKEKKLVSQSSQDELRLQKL